MVKTVHLNRVLTSHLHARSTHGREHKTFTRSLREIQDVVSSSCNSTVRLTELPCRNLSDDARTPTIKSPGIRVKERKPEERSSTREHLETRVMIDCGIAAFRHFQPQNPVIRKRGKRCSAIREALIMGFERTRRHSFPT